MRLLELWLLFRHADDPEDPAEPLKGLERQARYLLMAPETLESQNSYTYWLAAVAAVVSCCCCCLLLVMSATVAAVVSFSLGTCYPSTVSVLLARVLGTGHLQIPAWPNKIRNPLIIPSP